MCVEPGNPLSIRCRDCKIIYARAAGQFAVKLFKQCIHPFASNCRDRNDPVITRGDFGKFGAPLLVKQIPLVPGFDNRG